VKIQILNIPKKVYYKYLKTYALTESVYSSKNNMKYSLAKNGKPIVYSGNNKYYSYGILFWR